MSLAIIIFGITGDLSQTKLIPSLWQLYSQNVLPDDTNFFGYGRKPFDEKSFQTFIRTASPQASEAFISLWQYQQGQIDDATAYHSLATKVSDDRLIYLAVGPDLYQTIITTALQTNLLHKKLNHKIIIEKPFGTDETSAKDLNDFLTQRLDEEQIFRIDHYLGKPGLRNLISQEPHRLKEISLQITDTDGVGERGAFYDATGTLRDVVQSHLLELLATTLAWSQNQKVTPEIRAHYLSEVQVISAELGQYEGYTNEKNVQPDSQTETSARLELKYQDVRIHIKAERKAPETKSNIVINDGASDTAISLADDRTKLLPHALLISEALQNNHQWFLSIEEILAAWRIIDPLLKSPTLTKY